MNKTTSYVNDDDSLFVIVPLEKVSEQALTGLIDEFILREGTDYGQYEYTLEEKHAQIKKQLHSGKTVIVFDTAAESVSLLRQEHLKLSQYKK